jgi:NMD protein affecting ribosome stability and mRNA decay
VSVKPLPLCEDCGRRIQARRRWPFTETLCRRCYVKAWAATVLRFVPE